MKDDLNLFQMEMTSKSYTKTLKNHNKWFSTATGNVVFIFMFTHCVTNEEKHIYISANVQLDIFVECTKQTQKDLS